MRNAHIRGTFSGFISCEKYWDRPKSRNVSCWWDSALDGMDDDNDDVAR